MRRKILCGVSWLAAAVTVIGGAYGQAKWVGDRGAMEGELSTKDVQSSSSWVSYTIDSPSGPGRVRAKIDLRYRLWRLTGEPVWSFEPRYEFGTIELGSNSILRDDSLEGEALIAENLPDGSINLRVSRELFETIRLRDLHVVARFTQLAGVSDSIYHNAWISAVFDRPGEWGWDVPASPDWDETFTTQGEFLEVGEEVQQWIDEEEAKACWARLENAWRSQQTPALEYLRCYRMKLDLSNFWMRVEAQQPGATRPFFNRMVRGESFEQAAERNALEYQIQSLLNGVTKEVAASRATTEGPRATASLERRLEITEQAFRLLDGDAPTHLVESFETAKRQLTGDVLDERMRLFSESWQTKTEEVEILLEPATLEELESVGATIEADGAQVPEATRRRWELLQSLQSGFRGNVVAEWTGPALPASAQRSGMLGYIRLSELGTGPKGRALALFAWQDEFAHDDGHFGYILVDAMTGEELHRDLMGDHDRAALFGEAEFVANLQGNYYDDSFALRELWHVDSRRTLITPWEDRLVMTWDTRQAILMPRRNEGHVEAWDYLSGERQWRTTALSSMFGHSESAARFDSTGEWVLIRGDGDHAGAVLDAATGDLLFMVHSHEKGVRERFGSNISMDELEQEAYRMTGVDPSQVFVLPPIPAGYSTDGRHYRWSASGDAFLCEKPGTERSHEDSQRGSLRYQLLK